MVQYSIVKIKHPLTMADSKLPKHELFLRLWIGFVAFMALGNTLQCFIGDSSFLADKLYNGKPELMNKLTARLFGMWTLLACFVRGYCCIFLRNRQLYIVTMLSFVLAFLHFLVELFTFGTCKLEIGVVSPLIVSGISLIWMFIAQWFIQFDQANARDSSEARSMKVSRKKPL